jgi:uncharacterized protein YukE
MRQAGAAEDYEMPDVRMNYASMERMEKAFRQAAQTIEQTMRTANEISRLMENGALQGQAGDQFRAAINDKLNKRLQVLQAKMQELSQDVKGAVQATRDGISTAQSRFK